jgi:hypothetical protein
MVAGGDAVGGGRAEEGAMARERGWSGTRHDSRGRSGTSVMAHATRLVTERHKGAAPEAERHWEVADEIMRRRSWVNIDTLIEKRRKTEKRSKKCRFSSGTQ